MINEKKLHYPMPAVLYERRVGSYPHAFSDILSAGNLRPRHPVDHRFTVRTELRFAIRTHPGHAHLNQTHPAVTRRTQFGMVTISGNKFPGLSTSFDNACSLGELVPDAVDLYVEKWQRFTHNRLALFILRFVRGGFSVLGSICHELVAEFRDKTLRRPSAGFTKSADGSPGDMVCYRRQRVGIAFRTAPIKQTRGNLLHPKRSFPAGRALATTFVA